MEETLTVISTDGNINQEQTIGKLDNIIVYIPVNDSTLSSILKSMVLSVCLFFHDCLSLLKRDRFTYCQY